MAIKFTVAGETISPSQGQIVQPLLRQVTGNETRVRMRISFHNELSIFNFHESQWDKSGFHYSGFT